MLLNFIGTIREQSLFYGKTPPWQQRTLWPAAKVQAPLPYQGVLQNREGHKCSTDFTHSDKAENKDWRQYCRYKKVNHRSLEDNTYLSGNHQLHTLSSCPSATRDCNYASFATQRGSANLEFSLRKETCSKQPRQVKRDGLTPHACWAGGEESPDCWMPCERSRARHR